MRVRDARTRPDYATSPCAENRTRMTRIGRIQTDKSAEICVFCVICVRISVDYRTKMCEKCTISGHLHCRENLFRLCKPVSVSYSNASARAMKSGTVTSGW
jgi:hypothetical protein